MLAIHQRDRRGGPSPSGRGGLADVSTREHVALVLLRLYAVEEREWCRVSKRAQFLEEHVRRRVERLLRDFRGLTLRRERRLIAGDFFVALSQFAELRCGELVVDDHLAELLDGATHRFADRDRLGRRSVYLGWTAVRAMCRRARDGHAPAPCPTRRGRRFPCLALSAELLVCLHYRPLSFCLTCPGLRDPDSLIRSKSLTVIRAIENQRVVDIEDNHARIRSWLHSLGGSSANGSVGNSSCGYAHG